jgi:hypothetical protein
MAAKAAAKAAAADAEAAAADVGTMKRRRVATTVMVDGFAVKTVNNYGMEGGEPSIWDREASKRTGGADADAEIPARLLRQAFRHSGCCQACWDGGDLFCCDVCPAAYHGGDACAGASITALRRASTWRCPQHSCMECGRSASAAGGLIFRCQACPAAFCDEHLPEDVIQHGRIVDTCSRFAKLGWSGNKAAVFVHCSQECADFAAGGFDGWGDETGEEDAPAWVRPGDDALLLPIKAGERGRVPLPNASFAALSGYLLTVYDGKHELRVGPHNTMTTLRNIRAADGDHAYAALYAEARAAVLRNAPLKASLLPKPPPAPRPPPLARAPSAPGTKAPVPQGVLVRLPPSTNGVGSQPHAPSPPPPANVIEEEEEEEEEYDDDDDDEFVPDYEGIEFVPAYEPPPAELATALASPSRGAPATQPHSASQPAAHGGPSAAMEAWLAGADVAPFAGGGGAVSGGDDDGSDGEGDGEAYFDDDEEGPSPVVWGTPVPSGIAAAGAYEQGETW